MKVMTNHDWFDSDIESVTWEGHAEVREIILTGNNDGALLVNKDDAIALAKEFNLIVFEKDSRL